MRLAAGLCLDPLGELERSPRPLAAVGGRGTYLPLRGREGKEGDGKRERDDGKRRQGREGGLAMYALCNSPCNSPCVASPARKPTREA